MGLPQVTPGTYNYGEYSNPTPVKYNASGERSIGAGIKAAATAIRGKMDERKEEREAYQEEIGGVQAQLDVIKSEEQEAKNQAYIADIFNKPEYADIINPKLAMKLKRKNSQEYYRKKALFDNEIDDILGLKNINISEDVFKDIDIEDIKPGQRDNYLIAKQLSEGKFSLNRQNGRTHVELLLEDGSKKNVMLADLAENLEKYTDFNEKFNYTDADFNKKIEDVAKLMNKNIMGRLYTVKDKESGMMVADRDAVIEEIKGFTRLNNLVEEYAQVVFDDHGVEKDAFRDELANIMYDNYIDQVGNQIPKTAQASGRGSGKGLSDAELQRQAIDLFTQARGNFSKALSTAKGEKATYDNQTGIVTIRPYDYEQDLRKPAEEREYTTSDIRQYNLKEQKGARTALYREIFEDYFDTKTYTKEERQVAFEQFMALVEGTKAYVNPQNNTTTEGKVTTSNGNIYK